MITRIKIDGFKNLVGVELFLGPFTCIAGANAVGKSNLFDAITFLSKSAEASLLEAARGIRSEGFKNSDIRSLFHKTGRTQRDSMRFEVDLIIPQEGTDDLGQKAKAATTAVRYALELGLKEDALGTDGLIEVLEEELVSIPISKARKQISFQTSREWLTTAITGRKTTPFISTEREGASVKIRLHQDGQGGTALARNAAQLPKTVLSTADATQYPTATIVKNELRSWRLLQLEPSALRRPDEFHMITGANLTSSGAHLPATLYRLKLESEQREDPQDVYQVLTNNLSRLINDVKYIYVDKDDRRELLTLMLTGRDGTPHPARSLSDGTLRFLGLSVLEMDPKAKGVLCLEEPENGIHPEKIPAILELLQNIAVDPKSPVGEDNPLRQVIINTHSPNVVQEVPEDTLLVAELVEALGEMGHKYKKTVFGALPDTWRSHLPDQRIVPLGKLLAYLGSSPVNIDEPHYLNDSGENGYGSPKSTLKVKQREDIQQLKLF